MAPLGRIKVGDDVECNIKGRVFRAKVEEKMRGGLRITPPANYSYFTVTARQVTKHYPAAKEKK